METQIKGKCQPNWLGLSTNENKSKPLMRNLELEVEGLSYKIANRESAIYKIYGLQYFRKKKVSLEFLPDLLYETIKQENKKSMEEFDRCFDIKWDSDGMKIDVLKYADVKTLEYVLKKADKSAIEYFKNPKDMVLQSLKAQILLKDDKAINMLLYLFEKSPNLVKLYNETFTLRFPIFKYFEEEKLINKNIINAITFNNLLIGVEHYKTADKFSSMLRVMVNCYSLLSTHQKNIILNETFKGFNIILNDTKFLSTDKVNIIFDFMRQCLDKLLEHKAKFNPKLLLIMITKKNELHVKLMRYFLTSPHEVKSLRKYFEKLLTKLLKHNEKHSDNISIGYEKCASYLERILETTDDNSVLI